MRPPFSKVCVVPVFVTAFNRTDDTGTAALSPPGAVQHLGQHQQWLTVSLTGLTIQALLRNASRAAHLSSLWDNYVLDA